MPPSIAALESRIDALTFWLEVWTSVVVLGVLLEARSLWKALTHRQWVLAGRHVATVLVAVGVAGELFVQFKLSPVEGSLRARTAQRVARLDHKTAAARVRVARLAHKTAAARERAAKAEKRAAFLMAELYGDFPMPGDGPAVVRPWRVRKLEGRVEVLERDVEAMKAKTKERR